MKNPQHVNPLSSHFEMNPNSRECEDKNPRFFVIWRKIDTRLWHSRLPSHEQDLAVVPYRSLLFSNGGGSREDDIRKMAIHWTIPLVLLFSVVVVEARPPGLYWPTGDDHLLQTRGNLNENALNGLNENELETLLYLLDKVERPRVPIQHSQPQLQRLTYEVPAHYESRIKRTGHHAAQKKAVDWSDYFGIDKREVKREEVTSLPTPLPDAKDDKEREDILKEFYSNMAMAANVRRRKRSIQTTPMEKDMTKVGENLISEALKLTGAHRDEKMSKDEFKQFKKELMRRIGTAYDLEKLRHVFEGNMNKLSNNRNQVGQ